MPAFELCPAQRDELDILDHLLQFYLYELSAWLPLKLGRHGLYEIQSQDDYWRSPHTRPWLIRVDGELAGMACVDDRVHAASTRYNLGYLFISHRFRGQGLGRAVSARLLEQLPGAWQIVHIDANQPARMFWARVMPTLSGGTFDCQAISADGYPCTLYSFNHP
ncbi:GNAT family N-acetyltransferase [Pseudomonas sp. MF4836]|uniref:GNAT family N-acetyltransferase n=1 Tax=Pseudomonas sp. MF4836 TaxID=1960827 RepID=UPI0009974E62|nr:GNAT family N-acetyltransferase [Pseudomonas sp. MF4836]OOV94572.1 GNAT family N-acetyltransferase [Pseudomonas sp. MF4836]